jgi:hypothetical protein
MAYTTVPTFTDTSATAANGNTYIRDNQRALKDPPSQNYESNEGANYTRTGSAAFANVDADFNFSITTTGGDVIVSFVGVAFATSGGGIPLQFTRLVTGLAAGVHTFNLQWAVEDAVNTITLYAGAGTASYDLHPQFWVRELT